MTIGSPPLDGVATAVIEQISPLVNQSELTIVGALATVDPHLRISTALVWRGRTRADAVRFSHAADMPARMPDLFDLAHRTCRITADHLDTIWTRINRHLVQAPAGIVDDLRAGLDSVVEPAVIDWLSVQDGIVNLADLRSVIDAVLIDSAPGLAAETAQAERDSVRLTRRGRVLTLTAGDEIIAAGIDKTLEDKARALLAGLRRDRSTENPDDLPALPDRSELKAQILLDLLGDNPETLQVRVNLYRTTVDGVSGTGSAYSPEVGWLDAQTAHRLEALAHANGTVAVLPEAEDIPEIPHYRWNLGQRLHLEARDAHCRFPGCTVPAVRCEKDHIVNSPYTDPDSDGPTDVANGQNLCPEHHREKTLGTWRCSTPDGGHTIHWSGPHGETATTHAAGPLSTYVRKDREPGSPPG